MRSTEIKQTVAKKLLAQRKQILESHRSQTALACYVSPQGHSAASREHTSALQPWVEKEFLQSNAQVLLLKGAGGSGKSTFNQQVLCTLWQDKVWDEFKPGDQPPQALAPIWIPLGSHPVDPERLFNYFSQLPEPFTEEEINILKSDYRLLLIADGYDEMPGLWHINLYDANQLDRYEGRVKLLISVRIGEHIGEESTYFVPHRADGRLAWPLYKERYVAAFDASQRTDYITQYLAKHKAEKDSTLWPDVATYERHFANIPGIEPLLATPFVLMMAVETLPSIVAKVETWLIKDSKASEKKLEEKSQTLKSALSSAMDSDQPMLPMTTQGMGDCAFHAVLGEWDLERKMLVCPDPKEKRQQISKAIYAVADSKKNNRLCELSMAGIKELIMSGRAIGATTQILLQHYQQFLKDQDALQPALWDAFAKKLNEYPAILAYIEKHGHPKGEQTLRAKLYDALNKKEGELYGRLLSLPELNQAFRDYNLLRKVQFDWEAYLKEDAIKEYAEFVSQPGQWLLPHELEIIAIVFNIKIVFYAHKDAVPQIFNEGQYPIVHVQFNGLDHYEQLQSVPKLTNITLSLEYLYLTRSKLYDQFMAAWFSRQAEKAIASGQSLKDPEKILGLEVVAEITAQTSTESLAVRLLKHGYAEFCQHLAQHLQTQGRSTLRYPVEEKHEGRLTKKIKEKESPKSQTIQSDSALSLAKLFSKTADRMLIRQGCPLRQERSNEYSFLHASFIDYFVTTLIYQQATQQPEAKAIISEPVLVPIVEKSNSEQESKIEVIAAIEVEKPKPAHKQGRLAKKTRSGNPLTQRLMTRESIQFLADRVDQDEKFASSLWDWIERSKSDEATQTITAAANAITVLNAANKSFSDKDFNGIRIPGADLTGGIFHGTQLKNADLTGVNFTDAHLEEVDFSGSLMKDISLNERPVLKGHSMPIRCMAYDRERDIAATGSGALGKDCGIRIWDIKQSQLVDILVGHTDEVIQVLFRPGQKDSRLISLSKDQTIREWDVKEAKELRKWSSPSSLMGPASISSDGQYLACVQKGETVLEEKVDREGEDEEGLQMLAYLMTIQKLGGREAIDPRLWPKSMMAMMGGMGPAIHQPKPSQLVSIWDLTESTLIHSFAPHQGELSSLQWNPLVDSKGLVTSGTDKQLKLWDLTVPKKPQLCWEQKAPSSSCLIFLPDGNGILAVEAAGVIVRESKGGERGRLYRPNGLKGSIFTMSCDESGQYISAGDKENIEVWEAQTGHSITVLYGHDEQISALAFSSKITGVLVSVSYDRMMRLWQTERFLRPVLNQTYHTRDITSLLLSHDEKTLISGSLDGSVRFWQPTTGRLLNILLASKVGVTALALFLCGDELIVGDDSGDIHRFSLKTLKEEKILTGQHRAAITCLSVYKESWKTLLVSGSRDGTIRLWDLRSNKFMRTFKLEEGHLGLIQTLGFSEDGEIVYSCDTMEGGLEWRPETGIVRSRIADHKNTRHMVKMPKVNKVVSVSKEDIHIWNLSPQNIEHRMQEHQAPITFLNVTQNDQIISGDEKGKILLWGQDYAIQIRLVFPSPVKQALIIGNHYIYVCGASNSLLAYQISSVDSRKVARVAWRQGTRFYAHDIKAEKVQQLSSISQEALQLPSLESVLAKDTKEVSSELSPLKRYALDREGTTALIRAVKSKDDQAISQLLQSGVHVDQAGFDDYTPLQLAAKNNDVTTIKLLLEHKANLNQTNHQGVSSLYFACEAGYSSVIEILLRYKADGFQARNDGALPLCVAAQHGHVSVLKVLLDHKADANQAAKNGGAPLHVACQNGHESAVKLLLEYKADVHQSSKVGASLLLASYQGHESIIRVLVAHKANVNQTDQEGASPLFITSKYGHELAIKTLLEFKAEVNQANKHGITPLINASGHQYESVVKILLEYKADVNQADKQGKSPLFWVSRAGYEQVIKLLLKHKAEVNQAAIDGGSPLFIASSMGQVASVKTLLEYKANVNQAVDSGGLPLHVACGQSHEVIIKSLLEHKANVNDADKFGRSSLHTASHYGKEPAIKILLEHKADVNQADKNGSSPLFCATEAGHHATIKTLLVHKADVDQATIEGSVPLYIASQKGLIASVKTLLEYKANVNQTSKTGASSLNVASSLGHESIVTTLIEAKAEIDQTNMHGWSGLHAAAMRNQIVIVKLLMSYSANSCLRTTQSIGPLPSGLTALDIARLFGHATLAAWLEEHGSCEDQETIVILRQSSADKPEEKQRPLSLSTPTLFHEQQRLSQEAKRKEKQPAPSFTSLLDAGKAEQKNEHLLASSSSNRDPIAGKLMLERRTQEQMSMTTPLLWSSSRSTQRRRSTEEVNVTKSEKWCGRCIIL